MTVTGGVGTAITVIWSIPAQRKTAPEGAPVSIMVIQRR
jgi:hypothetical protein